MKVYVFGNHDISEDSEALTVSKELNGKIKNVNFMPVKSNDDLPFVDEKNVVILDVIKGIDEVRVINFNDIDSLVLSPRTSAHDFDLGFQLKYLKKLGKLKNIKIIGLPYGKRINYLTIQSILRKLVAQDMQGS